MKKFDLEYTLFDIADVVVRKSNGPALILLVELHLVVENNS